MEASRQRDTCPEIDYNGAPSNCGKSAVEASRQIENLIYTYAERIDAGDLEGVAELLRNAEILAPGVSGEVTRGYEAILAMYRQSTRIYPDSGTPGTRHLTTNVIVEVDGQQALARSCYTVIQATDALPLQPIISGRYHDAFALAEGRWEFRRRSLFVDLLGDCSAHLLYELP